ncbi:hypothetical protein CJP74_04460 [Psittacicella melopsittaci]|uniref:Peptidyl-prolyl cis-trans isomerase n=1 Tax=Psittacicella melopsittaci TaxID=2028576 RepID=A0A3A1Y8Q1_9GAMM|nr:hypothetical protein CJP74_04460 [Psittacicella melopsittaci]
MSKDKIDHTENLFKDDNKNVENLNALASTDTILAQEDKNTLVLMKTNFGDFKIELYDTQAPITVDNFLKYVTNKFYDGIIFHRYVKGFVLQGGGYNLKGLEQRTLEPIKNESNNGLSNAPYTLSMARTVIPDSATSQFFINLVDNSKHLDAKVDRFGNVVKDGYAVFGKIIEGHENLEHLKNVKVDAQDTPLDNLVIESVEVLS